MAAAMIRIEVEAASGAYPVLIGDGVLGEAGQHLREWAPSGRLAIVSDENVWAAWGEAFTRSFRAEGLEPQPIVLPAGEATKSWVHLSRLVDDLLELGVERGGGIAAFGGGVVGDLAGFAAAILKRGCRHVQVPTSLLAQVDSSVGGKTGINVAAGKNLVGAFHQPAAVLIDPAVLATLPDRELRAGYAEVVKYGLISDASFFAWCEANGAALLARDSEVLEKAIAHCVRAKAAIVAADERETTGQRALLNLGHTFGHALEAAAGYSDRLLHGEAVAIGLALAFRFSARRGLCPPADAERVAAHLAAAGLPTGPTGFASSGAELVGLMAQDKKMSRGRLPFILARGIGQAFGEREVDLADLAAFLDDQLVPAKAGASVPDRSKLS